MTTLIIFNIITAVLFVLFLAGTIMMLTAWLFKNKKVSEVVFKVGYKLSIFNTFLIIFNICLTKLVCNLN